MWGKVTMLTLSSPLVVTAVCVFWVILDEASEYPTVGRFKLDNTFAPKHRDLFAEDDCDEIPMANIESTWEWARKKRLTVGATGMIVYQNGNKLFEEYEPSNVCPIFCLIPPFRWLWNLFTQFGGSPTKKFTLFSGTKSTAGLAALMLVKQSYIGSLDDKVSEYIEQWKDDQDKAEITIRELLTLSSGIKSSELPFSTLRNAINAPFEEKKWVYGIEPFMVFGHIIQLKTGRSGWQYLDDEVFSKLDVDLSINSVGTDGVTNFYSGGTVTLPDLYKLAEEIMAAALGEGTLFNEQDIAELATAGVRENYGLTFWLAPEGSPPSCDPLETVSLNFIGALGQIATIFPTKRLIIVKSAGVVPHDIERIREMWTRVFQGVDCTCTA